MVSVLALSAEWRSRADVLEAHGATQAATTLRVAAGELDAAAQADADTTLTLTEAAAESGYSTRRLRELLSDGTVPQAGRTGAPRIRRADLPRRAAPQSRPGGYDVHADAAALAGRMSR